MTHGFTQYLRGFSLTMTCLLLLIFFGLSGAMNMAQAATFNVANGDVAGLIAAINAANTSPEPSTINLANGGTYTLTSVDNGVNGLPAITNPMTINGNGATIQRSSAAGTPNFRIFLVLMTKPPTISCTDPISQPANSPSGANVEVPVTVQDFNGDTLTVTWTVDGSVVQTDRVTIPASVTFSGLTISNGSSDAGGGILNYGTLTVTNSTLSGNSATNGGGGIYNSFGTVTVINSTLSGNSVPGGVNVFGGGIVNYYGSLTITNSTLSGNSAWAGGGISALGSTTTLTNSTLSGNSAYGFGGGGFMAFGGGTLIAKNTIVANSPRGGNCLSYSSVISQGHNLSDDTTCSGYFNQTGDLNNIPAGLDPSGLQNNGGYTQTIALNPGSAAIDAGDDCVVENPGCLVTPLATDQRGPGFPRKVGAHVDIGAFEYCPTCNPIAITPTPTPTNLTTDSLMRLFSLGSHTVSVSVSDGKNAVVSCSTTVTVTKSAPVARVGPDQTVECTGHNGATVTLNGSASSDPNGDALTFKWTDPGNNVVGTAAIATVTAPMGTTAYTLTVTDPGGLGSSATTQITVQDTTPPVLTLSQTGMTVVLPTGSAAGASVNLSGIASAADICDPSPTVTNNAPSLFPVGTTIVTFTATDHTGNQSRKNFSVQVVWNFNGYFMPIRNNGASLFQSGRTVPVKFALTATDGTIVTNAVANLQVYFVLTTPTGTVDETVNTLPSGSSNTGTLFRFDAASGQYIYNLSTSGFASGTYLLRTTLNDGTTHDVNFSIR